MNYFDTHAHLGLIVEDAIDQMIITGEAKRDGVLAILSVCNNLKDFSTVYKNLNLAKNVYYSVGISPLEAENVPRTFESMMEENLKLDRVVAVGETGLDYNKGINKNRQIELFIKHLELASKFNLPAVIHNREAGKDLLEILKSLMPSKGVVFHCFSENLAFAEEAMALAPNVYISFAGNVTYKNAKHLQEAAYHIPLDRMVVESESPFMIPTEYRDKKRTKPSYIHSTVNFIARLRDQDEELVAKSCFDNASKVFNLSLNY